LNEVFEVLGMMWKRNVEVMIRKCKRIDEKSMRNLIQTSWKFIEVD
jgi:hypothetical protein